MTTFEQVLLFLLLSSLFVTWLLVLLWREERRLRRRFGDMAWREGEAVDAARGELERERATANADQEAYFKEIAALKHQTRCPECGCATPEDAEAAECGCEAPVCMVPASSTLAREFVKALAERDAAVRDAKNAADMMVVANAEGLRYMRERDAALAAQNARAVKELQAIEKTLRNEWREADTTQCLVAWVARWIRDRVAALIVATPLPEWGAQIAAFGELKPEPASEPVPDPRLRDLIVAVYRMRDEWAESAEPVRNRLWAAVVQTAKRFEAEVFPLRTVPAAADAKQQPRPSTGREP